MIFSIDVCMIDTTTVHTTTAVSITMKLPITSKQNTTEKVMENFTETLITTSTANSTTSSTKKVTSTSTTPISSTIQATTTTAPATTRVVASSTSKAPTTMKILSTKISEYSPAFNQTHENETIANDASKDIEVVEDEHEVSEEPDFLPNGSYESDTFVNDRYMMKKTTKSDTFDIASIIKVSVLAISIVFLLSVAFLIAYHQYKKSTNPLNYKEKSENGSQKVNEEFSEIRYLTSEESLDFNIMSPATEL